MQGHPHSPADVPVLDIAVEAVGDYHVTPVAEFHQAFGHPVEHRPVEPSIEQRMLRVRLIAEELVGLADAFGVTLQVTHRINVAAKPTPRYDPVEAADALGDLRYVVDGGNLICGFPGERVLAEIHRSNMSKLGEDGKPVLREDGKVLKGSNYTPPDIASVLAWAAPQ